MRAVTRSADPADLNFILNSFLRSLRGYPSLRHVPNEVYYPEQKRVLEQYFKTSQIRVMCNSEIPDQIFGYIIGVPDQDTHFVYIKYPYRRFGFAKRLLEELHPSLYTKAIRASYTCRNWDDVSAKFKHLYNPYRESFI